MLFLIDESLDDVLSDERHTDYEDAIVELERLALARWRKKLVVFCESKKLAGLIADSPRFSPRAKSIFLYLNKVRSFKRELLTKMPVRVRVSAFNGVCHSIDASGVREIIVPIGALPHGIFDYPILLAENISDAKCYLLIGKMAVRSGQFSLPNVSLAGDLRGGGGSAIELEYRQAKTAAERLVLCFLDSDVRTPNGLPSPWRGRVMIDDCNNPSPIAYSCSIGVYSIENILPLGAFEAIKFYQSDRSRAHAISQDLLHWKAHSEADYWRYIALKKGISCDYLRVDDAYWVGRQNFFLQYSSRSCQRSIGNCKNSCLRFPKYPDNFLSNFVSDFEDSNSQDWSTLVSTVPAAVKPVFQAVASTVVAWLCVGGEVGVVGSG